MQAMIHSVSQARLSSQPHHGIQRRMDLPESIFIMMCPSCWFAEESVALLSFTFARRSWFSKSRSLFASQLAVRGLQIVSTV